MTAEPEDVRMMRLHKAWADRFTILSQIIVLMLFGAFYAILEVTNAAAADRTDTLILLAVMVLTTVVWQAVGLGVARVHMLIAGIDLEKLAASSRQARK